MNTRTKGGAKQEFKEKKLGLNQEILEYYDTKLQLYKHAYNGKERNLKYFQDAHIEWAEEHRDEV